MSTLILSLPAESAASDGSQAEYRYAMVSDADQILQQGSAAPSLLRQRAGQRDSVVGVVPAAVMSWHLLQLPAAVARSVLLPRTDNSRRRAVLAGALEEQLLDDPAQLHFAVAPAGPSAPAQPDMTALWVAVIHADWMRQTLQVLLSQGLHPERLVPEHEPMQDASAARLSLDGSLQPAAAVWSTHEGVWRLPLQPAVVRWLQERMTAVSDSSVQLLAEPEVLARAEQWPGHRAQAQTPAQRLVQAQASRWNLAQGEWTVGQGDRWMGNLRAIWRQWAYSPAWRPTRWALVALVLVQVAALNAFAWRVSRDVQAQRQQQARLLTDTFPQVTVVVDAPLQMQREVERFAQARGVSAGVDVAQVMAVLGQEAALSIATVELADGQMVVRGAATDAPMQDRVAAALTAVGMQARWSGDVLQVRAAEVRP